MPRAVPFADERQPSSVVADEEVVVSAVETTPRRSIVRGSLRANGIDCYDRDTEARLPLRCSQVVHRGPLARGSSCGSSRNGDAGAVRRRCARLNALDRRFPPRVTCTYRLPGRLLVVRHEAAYRDVAAALMAMGIVLAIAAYAAPARRTDGAASARG